MESLSSVGTVIKLINSAVSAVIEQIKPKIYENTTNSMNKTIMNNYSMDDLHR